MNNNRAHYYAILQLIYCRQEAQNCNFGQCSLEPADVTVVMKEIDANLCLENTDVHPPPPPPPQHTHINKEDQGCSLFLKVYSRCLSH